MKGKMKMLSIRKSEVLEIGTNGESVERMEIDVDTSSDLPNADAFAGKIIAQGSIAWDISTGDFYGMAGDGTWVVQ